MCQGEVLNDGMVNSGVNVSFS